MPIDSLLVSIAVCAMFLAFAAALAWADRQSSIARREPALVPQRAMAKSPVRQAA